MADTPAAQEITINVKGGYLCTLQAHKLTLYKALASSSCRLQSRPTRQSPISSQPLPRSLTSLRIARGSFIPVRLFFLSRLFPRLTSVHTHRTCTKSEASHFPSCAYAQANLPVSQDEDELSVYKIQSSHTIHMVKGVSRSGATTSSQPAAPQAVPTMQTGQNPHDPLTQLNSHMGFGAMAGFDPFTSMGLNPNDPNMVRSRRQRC